MKPLPDMFRSIKTIYDAGSSRDPALVCKTGYYGGCPVLKLQKAAWTNDDMRSLPNQTGIFFSIWVDEPAFRQGRIKYNIHALKLRQLGGYRLKSREFASDFREKFERVRNSWPNVSVDFGPQTLMQGWIQRIDRTLQSDLLNLMGQFVELSPIIDDLLAKRIVLPG